MDASCQQSEITKTVSNQLFQSIQTTGKSIFISGPLCPHNRGSGLLNRILSLHTWLQSAFLSHSVTFIDNFNLLCGGNYFFKTDGLHLNKLGSRSLTFNMHSALNHTTDYLPPTCGSPCPLLRLKLQTPPPASYCSIAQYPSCYLSQTISPSKAAFLHQHTQPHLCRTSDSCYE